MTDRQSLLRELNRRLRRSGVTPPRRAVILREVQAGLDEAAAELGEAEALRRLGDADELAREYAALERDHPVRVPRWRRGLAWAALILALLLLLQVFRVPTFGVIKWMDPSQGGSFWEVSLWPIARFYGDSNNGYVFDAAVGVWSYLIFPLAAFLVASSFWNWRGHDPA